MHQGVKRESSFIMHAILRMMSKRHSQSLEFHLTAPSLAVAEYERKNNFRNYWINHKIPHSIHFSYSFCPLFSQCAATEAHTAPPPFFFKHIATQVALSILRLSPTSPCRPQEHQSPKKQSCYYSRADVFNELPSQKHNCLSACPELRKIIARFTQISPSFFFFTNMLST